MKDLKNSIKDDDLDGVSGGIDITALGAKKTPLVQSLTKKRVPKKTLSMVKGVEDLASLSFEEKHKLARDNFGMSSEVDDMNEDDLTIRLKDAYNNRI